MRPTIALLRTAAPSRLTILASTVVIVACARLIGLGMGSGWQGSDEQGIARLLIDLGVLPVFAAMLGGALVRGEQAPWAWGLARPIARWRFAATMLGADLLLLVTAFGVSRGLLGEAPTSLSHDWLMRQMLVPHDVLAPFLIAIAYVGAAIGAARGHKSLRALPVGVAYGLAALFVAAVVVWLDRAIASFFVVDAWPTPPNSGLFDGERDHDAVVLLELFLGFGTIAIATLGGLAHALVRALASIPALLPRRELVAVFGLWIGAAALVSWTLHTRMWSVADAPRLALRGDATVVVAVDHLTDDVMLAQIDCESCFARASSPRGARAVFSDVEPGRYRLCAQGLDPSYDPRNTILRGGVRRYTRARMFETCTDVEVVAGPNQFSTAFDPANALPAPRERMRGREQHRPFEGLLLARNVAEFVLEAVRSDEIERSQRRDAPWFASP